MANAPAVPSVALWRQLYATAQVLDAVRSGQSGTAAIETVAPELRPAVQALVFAAWRNAGRARALRALLAPKRPAAMVDALLCLALALVWREDDAAYDAFTLVNQTIEAAKRHANTARAASFINACLRRFLRERAALVAATDTDLESRWNHPDWWVRRLQRDYPDAWQDHLVAANHAGPMVLRVNRRHHAPQQYLALLAQARFAAHLQDDGAIVLERAVPVVRLPGFARGAVSVQDAAAQRAAPLLLQGWEGRDGLQLLDACAAPGGKTAHLLELSNARVTALEIDAVRARRITGNLQRLQLRADVVVADAALPATWWDGTQFDGILLDAPCSASGIVRRHPDIRWLRRETDIDQLARVQQTLLLTLWPLVRPGGRLLYCTCSVFHAEGQDQVQTFLAHNSDAQLLPSPGHLQPTSKSNRATLQDNQQRDQDGFFYALFGKSAG